MGKVQAEDEKETKVGPVKIEREKVMTTIITQGRGPPVSSCFMHMEGQRKRNVEDDSQISVLGNEGDGRYLGRENNGLSFMHGG